MTSIWRSLPKDKLVGLAAFGFQAVSAVGITLILNSLLPPGEYSKYSLTVATSQAVSIGLFEWIRLASSRYYPGKNDADTVEQHSAIAVNIILATMVSSVVAIIFWLSGTGSVLAILTALLCIGQAITDIQMVMSRFRGEMRLFSLCQAVRAFLLITFGTFSAITFRTAEAALLSTLAAYVCSALFSLVVDREFWAFSLSEYKISNSLLQAKYGYSVASSSLMHQSSTLILRYAISFAVGPHSAAPFYFALDIMQRPFSVLTTALSGVFFPEVLASYRSKSQNFMRGLDTYKFRLLAAILLAAISLSTLVYFLGAVIDIAKIKEAMTAMLLSVVIFASRATLQTILSVEAHLSSKVAPILCVGVTDIAFSSSAIAVSQFLLRSPWSAFVAAILGVVSACAFNFFVQPYLTRRSV